MCTQSKATGCQTVWFRDAPVQRRGRGRRPPAPGPRPAEAATPPARPGRGKAAPVGDTIRGRRSGTRRMPGGGPPVVLNLNLRHRVEVRASNALKRAPFVFVVFDDLSAKHIRGSSSVYPSFTHPPSQTHDEPLKALPVLRGPAGPPCLPPSHTVHVDLAAVQKPQGRNRLLQAQPDLIGGVRVAEGWRETQHTGFIARVLSSFLPHHSTIWPKHLYMS